MSPSERTRVPPDVARRLAALAGRTPGPAVRAPAGRTPAGRAPAGRARVDGGSVDDGHVDDAAGRVVDVRVDARVGWTPPAPPGLASAHDPASWSPPPWAADLPDPLGPPERPALPLPGPSDLRGPSPRPAPPDLPDRPERAWDPSVAAALAEAAGPVTRAPVPRVRWAPGWRAAGAAVLVLALVAGGLVLRAASAPRGEPVAVPTPAGPAAPGGTGAGGAADGAGTGGADASGAAELVVVHVVGAVAQPGVVHLALGARVADALAAAGGGLPEADLAGVNLARVLADGEQLVVPVMGEHGAGAAARAAQDALVDLNTADATALEALPGVGPVLAARIVQHRTEHPFTAVDDLDDVPGIGPALLADLRERVRV